MTTPTVAEVLSENGITSNFARSVAAWIQSQRDAGGDLSFDLCGKNCDPWLGRRLFWWPQGRTIGQTVGIVTSRLGNRLDDKKTWFAVLRAACAKLGGDEWLVACPETAAGPFVERCSELFDLRLLRIQLPNGPLSSLARWLNGIQVVEQRESQNVHNVFMSPELTPATETTGELDDLPLADRAVIAASDKIIALSIRRGGNIHRLIERQLGDKSFPAASIHLGLGPGLVGQPIAGQLMDQGALGWHVLGLPTEDDGKALDSDATEDSLEAPVMPVPQSATWQFLTHCTRRQAGPWPGQDEDEFLDDAILDRAAADHSPLSALIRIIKRRRLIASSKGIRGATAVVSFTAVPLVELPELRRFRPHRVRWDFEPYGICIWREWLEKCGCQAVQYGDDDLWHCLDEAHRPFFQVAESKMQAGNEIDWSVEREWRVIGDLDLEPLRCDEAFVFVRTELEAHRLARISPWPVAVADSCKPVPTTT